MNEPFKPGRGWRIVRRILISLAVLATLIALFYTEEDWRGWHAWNRHKQKLEAQGVQLDFKAFIPKPVPADQNFFMAPVFAGVFNGVWNQKELIWVRMTNVVNRLNMSVYGTDSSVLPPTGGGNWLKGTTTDLEPWQQYYRALAAKTNEFPATSKPQTPAASVLLALSKYNSTIEALRQAGKRPYARFPFNYTNPIEAAGKMLPLLVDLKGCIQVLQLRAIAEMQNGESQKALDDVLLMLRLGNALRDQPYLISDLVRIAVTSITLQPIYEGLAKHQWTDAQLRDLEQALRDLNFLRDFQFTAHGEQAFVVEHLDYYRRHREELAQAYFTMAREGMGGKVGNYFNAACIYLMPSGWIYQNKLAVVETEHGWNSKLMDPERGLVFPRAIDQAASTAAQRHEWPWNFLARESPPAIATTAMKTARIQVDVDLALTACALERYRLAHGEYPESLDALAPRLIKKVPHDIFGGKPLRYRRTADGNFVLYSIGWNEKDDGGVFAYPAGDTSGNPVFWGLPHGDWVWQYPVKSNR